MILRTASLVCICLCLATVCSATSADPATTRKEAMTMLHDAYTDFSLGMAAKARNTVLSILKKDPDFAYANIVMAQFLFQEENWGECARYFEKGLSLLNQPNQPISPDAKLKIPREAVEGDSRCQLGYVYIQLAQAAQMSGNSAGEQKYLGLAKSQLEAGLKLQPSQELRQVAMHLLQSFR